MQPKLRLDAAKRSRVRIIVLLGAIATMTLSAHARAADVFITDGDTVAKSDGTTLTKNFVGPLEDASLGTPAGQFGGITFGPDGNLYVASSSPAGEVFRANPATGAQIGAGPFVGFGVDNSKNVQAPAGLKFGTDGNLYVPDVTISSVNLYDASGVFVSSNSNGLVQPVSLAFDSSGGLYVADASGIEKYNSVTQQFESYIQAHTGGVVIATDLAFGPDHKLYIVDESTDKVWRYDTTNGLQSFIDFNDPNNFFVPAGLAFEGNGDLLVSVTSFNNGDGEVLQFDPNGNPLGTFATGLNNPTFIAVVPEPGSVAIVVAGLLLLNRSDSTRRR